MSIDPMKAVLEAQKKALEVHEKLMRGEIRQEQMASEYMSVMADIMPDFSSLNEMAAFNPTAIMQGGFGDFEDDEDDTDYNIPSNIMSLCDYFIESMDSVLQLASAPPVSVSDNDAKWLQMGILCSGILSSMNGHNLDSLFVEEPDNDDFIEHIEEGLEEAWGIESREDLLEMLTWLYEKGHRVRYTALCKAKSPSELIDNDMDEDEQESVVRGFIFAQHFKSSKSEQAMLGWDLGRSALLIRFGFYVGWISESEASSMLITIAKSLSSTYGSWQEFGASYQFGAAFWKVMGDPWSAKENTEAIADAVSELLTSDMFGIIGEWGVFPWLLAK